MTDTPHAPLVLPSASFETQRFTLVDDVTLRVRPSIPSQAFSLLFTIAGIGLLGLWGVSAFTAFEGTNSFLLPLIGAVFMAVGVFTYRQDNTQLIINRDTGAAFVRSWWPSVPLDTRTLYLHIKPDDIVAIQTVSRTVESRPSRKGKVSRYTQIQVNLRTRDNQRHNAFVTLKAERANDLATHLARILNVEWVMH